MRMNVQYTGDEIVVGKGFINYPVVLDDFKRAKCVRVMTYNISRNDYRNKQIDALKSVCEDADVKIISNISSRMETYYNSPGVRGSEPIIEKAFQHISKD